MRVWETLGLQGAVVVLLEKSKELVKSNNKQMRLSCAKGINKMLCHSEEGVVGDLSV